ncbi:MAG: hypothetical protein ACLFWH_13645 [Actinomycetota bacterium]
MEDSRVVVMDGEDRYEISGFSEPPVAGGFVDEKLVFSVGCCDGIWVWDYQTSVTAELVVEGNSDRTILHGVAPIWDEPGFFYTTPSDQPGDIPDIMFYNVIDEQPHQFLDTSERASASSEEEQSASVGSIVATQDRIGILFAFGDSTWVEWYTETTEPAESPFPAVEEGDTVLELALAPAGDTLAVGREEQLHQGVSTIEVMEAGRDDNSYSVPDVQALRQLQFDGRYVTASTHRNDQASGPSARLILDTENALFSYSTDPRIIALDN